MLKMLLYFLLLSVPLLGQAQKKDEIVYLRRDNFGSVYITSDTTRVEYDLLKPRDLTSGDFELYNRNTDSLYSDTIISVRRFSKTELYPDWVPLYLYNSKLYIYKPSDWLNHYTCHLTDSAILVNTTIGPYPLFLNGLNNISENKAEFSITEKGEPPYKITITYFPEKYFALWEYQYPDRKEYQFMTPAHSLKNFPLVVCECGDVKCKLEFKFEKPVERTLRRLK